MSTWRFLYTGSRSGAENMAIDEALHQGVINGTSLPAIRLYRWRPACLSLGFLQRLNSVAMERARSLGLDIVRRPTGGLAVLHGTDICYSVTGKLGQGPLPQGVSQANFVINEALRAALARLGIEAEIAVSGEQRPVNVSVCIEMASQYELTVNGKKIAGSAQLQTNGALLQHGSLAVSIDPERIAYIFGMTKEEKEEKLINKATGIEEAAKRSFYFAELATALKEGFRRSFSISLEPKQLSATEQVQAEQLLRTKYASHDQAWRGIV